MSTQNESSPPFSVRSRTNAQLVDGSFPEPAQIGLVHLLSDLVERKYVRGWEAITKELARISRTPTSQLYDDDVQACTRLLSEIQWKKAFDFCERLYSHLAQEVTYIGFDNHVEVETPRPEIQKFIADELSRLFLEEGLAYTFVDGQVRRAGRRHSNESIQKAGLVLGDPRLSGARKHFSKAQGFFRDSRQPDFENAIKEAVCAVEAAGKALFPEAKSSTLGELVTWLVKENLLPKGIGITFTGLYAYRSGGEGVGHGGAQGGPVSSEFAEYALSSAASQIILLVEVANRNDSEIPF